MHALVNYLADNQNNHVSLGITPEAICLDSLGVYRLLDNFSFSQVDIFTQNPLEKHHKYNIHYKWRNNFFDDVWEVENQYHTWNKKNIFLAFYLRPTAHRLGLASYLHKHYQSDSLIHFSATTDIDNLMFFELDKLLTLRKESISDLAEFIVHLPVWSNGVTQDLSTVKKHIVDEKIDTIHKSIYQDVLIDIVAESHVLGTTFFPTEKTCRPMWLKKPFIISGSKNYLEYLHQMGFRTFADFWDEDYDGYEGRDRYLKILKLIDSLASMPRSELEKMYWDMQYTLDHNYNLLLTQTYNKNIKEIT
jgi:hypothetical protein